MAAPRLGCSAIVGRDAELRLLTDAVRAARQGRGGAVFLVGDAGIGKTRLAEEAKRLGADTGLVVLRGRATALSPVPYRPLSEALLSVLRTAQVPGDAALAPYLPALSRLVPEWRLRRPPGSDDSLVVLAEAVLRLLSHVGAGHGCLVVLEDLHDADRDTLAVVEYLVDNLDREPLLLLGTLRPEPGAPLTLTEDLAVRRVATVLELGRLDDEAVTALAAGCLDTGRSGIPAAVLDRLRTDAEGVPFYVEELLTGMISDGSLVPVDRGWELRGQLDRRLPGAVLRRINQRATQLGGEAYAVLRAAAVLGRRFAASIVATVTGLDGARLLAHLRAALDARLVVAEDDPDMYAFRHALTAEALRADLLPAERVSLSRRAAEAIESAFAGLPDGWCQLAAELRVAAGDTAHAAVLFHEAGRRATAKGALAAGLPLLERALSLVERDGGDLAADIVGSLLDAYVVAGEIDRAVKLGARFEAYATRPRQLAMRLRLARADAAAGRWDDGLREVATARALLGSAAGSRDTAPVDAVAARLAFGKPTPDRVVDAERLARRALRAAESARLPEVACDALEVLSSSARLRDLAAADALTGRAIGIADEHGLTEVRVRLLYQLGGHEGIRFGTTDGLLAAKAAALAAGAVITALDVDSELAVVHLTRGEYDRAEQAARQCEETCGRLRLHQQRLIGLGLRICVAAHQGRRDRTDELLRRFEGLGGGNSDFTTALYGFGLAFCSLLEEDRQRALAELSRAVAEEQARPTHYLSLTRGAHLLLATLSGQADRRAHDALAASAHGQAAWNRRFIVLSRAVLDGREGEGVRAAQAVREFVEMPSTQPLAHHLGLRLVAQAAVEDGWGEPARWLRQAEAYFRRTGAAAVVGGCRDLLRRAGYRLSQNRRGSTDLPAGLRGLGVTVREYEVLRLVAARLSNRTIAQRLFLSPRTVEKHVSSLLAKTGQADRSGLARLADGAPPGEK